ncbi:MAG: glycyl-radical enzyme activating protein [Dehalococcoidales bacterium]|nr:glycyl-radical enzyme activating protein [Dehalococcoidales bacterium]
MSGTSDGVDRVRGNPGDTYGTVFNIQRYSLQDGPGIRTTVFLKGCPLRCSWCSNPESQKPFPEIAHRDSLCTRCGRCIDVCALRAIALGAKGVVINRKLCTNCARCVDVCPPAALKVFGEEMSAADVFRQVQKDEEFYRESGGGVTVSGGDPLSQPDFVAALFRYCREKDIHTCIETSGFASIKAWKKVLPHTSLVLFDIKLADTAAHRKWTGQQNGTILRNLGLLVMNGVPVIIRVPLIPGVNDTQAELRNIAGTLACYLKAPGRIDLLPYHQYGLGKYQMLDRKYRLEAIVPQTETAVQNARQLFESYGFKCEVVG